MRLIDADALLTERKKSKYYHLPNGDIAIPIIDVEHAPTVKPKPQWIPCSERLPERADNVIICYEAGDYTLVSTGRYLYKFKMWYVDVVGDLRDGVTAWMSLPEPYRGGGTE